MSKIATAEQMYALGTALAAHGITTQAEACELWTTATGGELRALTPVEADELVDRLTACPVFMATVRPPSCGVWIESWPRRTKGRTDGTR